MRFWLLCLVLLGCAAPAVYYEQPPSLYAPPVQEVTPVERFSLAIVNGRPDIEQLTVPQGTLVELEVSALDNGTFFFVIDGYDVQEQLVSGSRVLITFLADKRGLFHYGSRKEVVKGSLVVT